MRNQKIAIVGGYSVNQKHLSMIYDLTHRIYLSGGPSNAEYHITHLLNSHKVPSKIHELIKLSTPEEPPKIKPVIKKYSRNYRRSNKNKPWMRSKWLK